MRNYDGDEEYQQYVRSYGGHRSEAGYIRYLEEIREDLESRLKALSKKTRDYLKWEDYQLTNNMVWIDSKNIRHRGFLEKAIKYGLFCRGNSQIKYEGFLVEENRISRQQYKEIEDVVKIIPFRKICLVDSEADYNEVFSFLEWCAYTFIVPIIVFIACIFLGGIISEIFEISLGVRTIGIKIIKYLLIGIFGIRGIKYFPTNSKRKNFTFLKSLIHDELKKLPQQLSPMLESIESIYKDAAEKLVDEDKKNRIIFNYMYNILQFRNMAKIYMPKSEEELIIAYDDTIGHSFKDGFLLTDKTLYFSDAKQLYKIIAIGVDEIDDIILRNDNELKTIIIICNGKEYSLGRMIGNEGIVILYELLKNSVSILKHNTENAIKCMTE